MTPLRGLTLFIGALALGGAAERLSRRTGATDAEARGTLPGDDVIAHPAVEWTRAATIRATPAQIWPWLVQMGYGRGGWYTNERFDRLVWRVNAVNADEILPEYQQLAVGDIVADGPEHAAYFHVRAVEQDRAVVYHSIRHPYRGHPLPDTEADTLAAMDQRLIGGGTYLEFSWAFVLHEIGAGETRLIIRTRADYAPPLIGWLAVPLGLVDLFHVHTMLGGIRRRVEAQP